jgi:hypothetical protein
MKITAHAHDSVTPAARPSRRADAGSIRLSQRDIDGLLLRGEHWGAPTDLLPAALRVEPGRRAQVIYLTAAPARSVVARAAGSLPPAEQARVVVRELPGYAFTPEVGR